MLLHSDNDADDGEGGEADSIEKEIDVGRQLDALHRIGRDASFSEVIGHLVSQSPGQNRSEYNVEVDWRRDHGERRATGDKVAQDPAADRGQTRENKSAEDVIVLPAREKDARNGERDGADDIEEVEPRSLHGDGEQHGHGVVPEDHVVFPGSF